MTERKRCAAEQLVKCANDVTRVRRGWQLVKQHQRAERFFLQVIVCAVKHSDNGGVTNICAQGCIDKLADLILRRPAEANNSPQGCGESGNHKVAN